MFKLQVTKANVEGSYNVVGGTSTVEVAELKANYLGSSFRVVGMYADLNTAGTQEQVAGNYVYILVLEGEKPEPEVEENFVIEFATDDSAIADMINDFLAVLNCTNAKVQNFKSSAEDYPFSLLVTGNKLATCITTFVENFEPLYCDLHQVK